MEQLAKYCLDFWLSAHAHLGSQCAINLKYNRKTWNLEKKVSLENILYKNVLFKDGESEKEGRAEADEPKEEETQVSDKSQAQIPQVSTPPLLLPPFRCSAKYSL